MSSTGRSLRFRTPMFMDSSRFERLQRRRTHANISLLVMIFGCLRCIFGIQN